MFLILDAYHSDTLGRDRSVCISTRYGLNGPGIYSRRGGAKFSTTVQTGPGARPAYHTMGTGGKAAGTWGWPPIPYSAEVKESLELYLFPPGGALRGLL